MITVTKTTYNNVKRDGTFEDQLGAVETDPMVRMSHDGGGCNMEDCHCSDGHWIMIGTGRDSYGTIEVLTVNFESQQEMDRFFKFKELRG